MEKASINILLREKDLVKEHGEPRAVIAGKITWDTSLGNGLSVMIGSTKIMHSLNPEVVCKEFNCKVKQRIAKKERRNSLRFLCANSANLCG